MYLQIICFVSHFGYKNKHTYNMYPCAVVYMDKQVRKFL